MTPQWTEVVWVDLLGTAHTLLRRNDLLDEPVPVSRGMVAPGDGTTAAHARDLLVRPDRKTLRANAFRPGTDVVLADLAEVDGRDSELCARTALRRVLGEAGSTGFDVYAAVELEAYLVDPATSTPAYRQTDCYGMARSAQFENLLAPLRNGLLAMDIEVEASNLEYSGGQVEVNLRYAPALKAADDGVLLRVATQTVAQRCGLEATFMAKPWTDQAGSGMHVHQSLWRAGRNAFAEPDGSLSGMARSYLAGLLDRMVDLTLLGSPTANAYHRRVSGSFAPTVVGWGGDNRTLAVRAITSNPAATRLEQRDASADCNIYLALAGQVAAGMDGVGTGRIPPPPVTGNSYARTDLPRLPSSIVEAHDRFAASAFARRAIGDTLTQAYLDAIRLEVDLSLRSSAGWERRRHLGGSVLRVDR